MNCRNCQIKKRQKKAEDVIRTMYEKKLRHRNILCLVLLLICVFLLGCVIYEKTAYEVIDESYIYTQDGNGNNIIGEGNEIWDNSSLLEEEQGK